MPVELPEVAACGLVEITRNGVVTEINDTMLGWIDRTADEVIGASISNILELRLPVGGENLIPSDAIMRRRSGSVQPVVVGSLEWVPDERLRLAVFDISAGSAFESAFHVGTARTRRGQERLRILLAAATAFAETRTEEEVAELLSDVAARSFAATSASVHLRHDGDLKRVGGVNPLEPYWPKDYRPTGERTYKGGEVILVRSPEEAQAYAPEVDMISVFRQAGIKASLACPIMYKEQALGAMICYFDHPREFDDEAAPLAESLANLAAQAVGRLRLEERLRRAAMHDPVTGLPNRRLFEEQVGRMLEGTDDSVCVIFIDMDGFKAVNDRLGHAMGDELLREVAMRLRDVVRDVDAVGRFGGDEFIAIANVSDASGAEAMCERIRDALNQPYPLLPTDMKLSASVGAVVAATGTVVASDQLIRAADHAMYEAKLLGGDRVHVTAHDR